jgi:hypothetical protein
MNPIASDDESDSNLPAINTRRECLGKNSMFNSKAATVTTKEIPNYMKSN